MQCQKAYPLYPRLLEVFLEPNEGKRASDLLMVMEKAGKQIPDELRQLARSGGGGGHGEHSRLQLLPKLAGIVTAAFAFWLFSLAVPVHLRVF